MGEIFFKNLKLFHPFIIGETFDLLLEEHVDQDLSQLIHSSEYLLPGVHLFLRALALTCSSVNYWAVLQ